MPTTKPTLPDLLGDFRVLLYLFVGLRVVLLLVYQPQVVAEVERGLTTLGDFREHYSLAQAISVDNLPYRDYWVEFPPIWIGLAAILAGLAGDFTAWATWVYLILLAVDVGNLVLVRRLGDVLHGLPSGLALAWVYGLMAAPLVMLAWNFEALVSFSLLAGLYFWLKFPPNQPLSAGLVALGILAKYVPVLLLPTVWRFSPPRTALMYTAGVAVLVLVVLGPLVAWGGEMAVYSLTVQFDKPSYQTIWAVLDGNYGTGSFPVGAARYQTDVALPGNAATLPGWLRLGPFAGLGLWIFRLPMATTPQHQTAFLAVTITLFMLWSQGWSPQWAVILIPLILLNFPQRVGVLVCLALTVGAFMEYPMLFRATADTDNLIRSADRPLFVLLIGLRTAILIGLSGVLIGRLRGSDLGAMELE